jgi:hypothetical protein
MSIRLIGALLCGGLLALVSTTSALAQSSYSYPHNSGISPTGINTLSGVADPSGVPRRGKISDNESPRPQDRTTVKNSKSNTSDRMGGGGGVGGTGTRATQDHNFIGTIPTTKTTGGSGGPNPKQ